MTGERPTVATVDLAAVVANFEEARRLAHGRDVIGVVKADAYGHGAIPVARRLVATGCRRLAVATVSEALALRESGLLVPILVLGGVHDTAEAEAALAARVTLVLHHPGHVELLRKVAAARPTPVGVQVEIDTGMRRMGVPPEEAVAFLSALRAERSLRLEGLFTHLARADEADLGPVREQLDRFRAVLSALRSAGHEPGALHVANSAGLVAEPDLLPALPETHAVRPGLLLYGVQPASGRRAALHPVMTLRTRVVQVRRVRPGEGIGYGHTFHAERETRIATLPAGYADGVPWSASNRGSVLLGGRRVPIVGRVSMDYVTVDVGDARIERGDEAIVFGAGLPVEEAAAAAGTLPYELLVRVGARVPRVYVE